MRSVDEAQAAHLRDLGELNGFDGGSGQGEVEQQDLAVDLGGDRRGQARRVGLGDARRAHALHGGVPQGHDQVGGFALGVFVKLTQAVEGGQVVVLPRLAIVASLGVQPQETPDGQAAAEEARATRRSARYLPRALADPH